MAIYCTACRAELPDEADQCGQCGEIWHYCRACRAHLPGNAHYCYDCGARREHASERVPGHGPGPTWQWEICEVKLERLEHHLWLGGYTVRFVAQAYLPHDTYIVSASEPFRTNNSLKVPEDEHTIGLVSELLHQLTARGWEPLRHGSQWYSYRFRRRLHEAA